MVDVPGPPWVDMKTTSKLASAAMMVIVTQTPISLAQPGQRDRRNCCDASRRRRAARPRRGAASILPMPAISSSVQSPVASQVPMTPTAGSAQVKSPSQARVQRLETDGGRAAG